MSKPWTPKLKRQARKIWTPSHTAQLAVYRGKGWPDWRIARALGFTRQVVQRHSQALGLSNRTGPAKTVLGTVSL